MILLKKSNFLFFYFETLNNFALSIKLTNLINPACINVLAIFINVG